MLRIIFPNIKCETGYDEIETEDQLLDVFSDETEFFYEVKENFLIKNLIGLNVDNVKDFLRISVGKKPKVKLEGSGYIRGVKVNNPTCDLSNVRYHTKDWDKKRDGTCHSCRKYTGGDTKNKPACDVNGFPTWYKNCQDYDPILKNAEGGPARTLDELIEEATPPYVIA